MSKLLSVLKLVGLLICLLKRVICLVMCWCSFGRWVWSLVRCCLKSFLLCSCLVCSVGLLILWGGRCWRVVSRVFGLIFLLGISEVGFLFFLLGVVVSISG